MARIVMNGSLKILPEPPPAVVRAHRDLGKIHRRLMDYKLQLDNSSLELRIKPLIEDAVKMRGDYVAILSDCERALKSETFSLPQGSRAYYEPVLTFVSRSENAHFILPFIDYLDHVQDVVELKRRGKERRLWPFPSLESYKSFISERIDDSIQTCRSYLALLSNSLDSFVQGTDINGMLEKIFSVQKTVAIFKSDFTSDTRDNHQFLEDQIKKSTISLSEGPKIENIGPILFFLFQQTVSNAFKASLVAGSKQKEYPLHLGKEYRSISEIQDPFVRISTYAISGSKTLVRIEDNGIGIPRSLLPRIFSNEKYPGVFSYFAPSNGSSTRIMPFISDLTGTEIEVKSEIGKGTRFEITVPSLN